VEKERNLNTMLKDRRETEIALIKMNNQRIERF